MRRATFFVFFDGQWSIVAPAMSFSIVDRRWSMVDPRFPSTEDTELHGEKAGKNSVLLRALLGCGRKRVGTEIDGRWSIVDLRDTIWPMMKAWEVTAMTNFIAAGEAFLAAGFLLGRAPLAASASGFWALTLLFLAAGLLAGGINHGFFEQKPDPRGSRIMQKVTWICAGVTTFFTLLTALYQFAPAEWRAARRPDRACAISGLLFLRDPG